MAGITLTRSEFEKIKTEYERMKRVDRKEIIKAISDARDQGDLSENAEYTAAKEKQVFIETKISRYEEILATARVIEDDAQTNEKIHVGSRVTILDKSDGEVSEYLLTSAVDFNIHDLPTISTNSQVGKALIGKTVGDVVEISIPTGKLLYEVISHQ
ncbi:transcription elongation factor GreA [candidate division KSB1 bacterium]|nr:transcription elongation factor GreA [candidate division KSB1 bacterium]